MQPDKGEAEGAGAKVVESMHGELSKLSLSNIHVVIINPPPFFQGLKRQFANEREEERRRKGEAGK